MTTEKPKFYGRRQGRKIRKAKGNLLDRFLPKIKIDKEQSFQKIFSTPFEKTYLEIGFGDGTHLAGIANQHKDCSMVSAIA